MIYPKNCINQTNQTNKHFVFKIILLTAGNCKPASGPLQISEQLQNKSVNGAMVITMNRVIRIKNENYQVFTKHI